MAKKITKNRALSPDEIIDQRDRLLNQLKDELANFTTLKHDEKHDLSDADYDVYVKNREKEKNLLKSQIQKLKFLSVSDLSDLSVTATFVSEHSTNLKWVVKSNIILNYVATDKSNLRLSLPFHSVLRIMNTSYSKQYAGLRILETMGLIPSTNNKRIL